MTASGSGQEGWHSRAWVVAAFAWGFAEATLFFIVPDVLTSRLVLSRPRRGFAACIWACCGSLLGGLLLFGLAQEPAVAARLLSLFDYIPGISQGTMETARRGLELQGLNDLFRGGLSGVPYKIYAVLAALAGVNFWSFLAYSIAARLLRFLLVTGTVWLIAFALLRHASLRVKLGIHAGAWTLVYLLYFTLWSGPA